MNRNRLAVIIGLVGMGFLATAILCPAGGPGASVVDWIRHRIADAIVGHPTPPSVDSWKPPGNPGEHISVTGGGAAVWTPTMPIAAGDSIPVTVQVALGPGPDTAIVTIGADSIPIAVDIEIDGPILPFRVWAESAFDGPSVMYGGGLSWEPLRLWGASAGPGACAGDGWVSPVFRVSRPVYSTIHAGAEAGWRFQRGPDEIHIGISAGFEF